MLSAVGWPFRSRSMTMLNSYCRRHEECKRNDHRVACSMLDETAAPHFPRKHPAYARIVHCADSGSRCSTSFRSWSCVSRVNSSWKYVKHSSPLANVLDTGRALVDVDYRQITCRPADTRSAPSVRVGCVRRQEKSAAPECQYCGLGGLRSLGCFLAALYILGQACAIDGFVCHGCVGGSTIRFHCG